MRRAGLDWELICKITGHKSTQNLIRHYDTMLESQGELCKNTQIFASYFSTIRFIRDQELKEAKITRFRFETGVG